MQIPNLIRTILAIMAIFVLGYFVGKNQSPSSPQITNSASSISKSSPFVVKNQTIYALNGRVAYKGDVDIAPVLARIERGERDPHRNDGNVHSNREGKLPKQKKNYYHEYVVRTPGLNEVGPQRVILGQNNEVYYTPDHYETFARLR